MTSSVQSAKESVVYNPNLLPISAVAARAKKVEESYLNTHKVPHLGGKETAESRLLESVSVFCPTHTQEEMAERLSNYSKASQYLSSLTEKELESLLASATPRGRGTGGDVLSIEVEGVPVFIKKIRLTGLEEANPRSTANLFALPTFYQYGVRSTGFGVWRELASHEMTTEWVRSGECPNFPLMYHSCILKRPKPPETTPEQLKDREELVAYWDSSAAIGRRLEAIDTASADVVVFMESLPPSLHEYLFTEGEKPNLSPIESEMLKVVSFMKSHDFLHLDAHMGNILYHNGHVYFTDFGLAMSRSFSLSPEEIAFFETHRDFDRYNVAADFVFHLIEAGMPSSDSIAIALRYEPIAKRMGHFFQGLREESKSTPYPGAELAREWSQS